MIGIVVDGQGPVRGQPHVQLDPVGAQRPGPDEGLQGVLADADGRVGAAPVGLDGDRSSSFRTLLELAVTGPLVVAKSGCELPQKLLATVGAGDYSSERTLNGR